MHRSHWSGGGARLPEIASDAWLIWSLTSATKSAPNRPAAMSALWSLLGARRTWLGHSGIDAIDPFQTSGARAGRSAFEHSPVAAFGGAGCRSSIQNHSGLPQGLADPS